MAKLDIGCGMHCLEGADGLDWKSYPGVKFVHNMNQAPWPIPDNTYEYLRCQHVIEHIEDLFALATEIHRVALPGATVEFKTPHFSSYASYGDPTHRWHFALGSIPQLFSMALGEGKYEVVLNKVLFSGSLLDFPGWLWFKISPKKYEKHFAWRYPANEIHTVIRIKK